MTDEAIKLLMIEDDMVDRMAFERAVKAQGLPYDYACVSSVAAGKEALRSNNFDVVISDFRLGDGTAFDVIDEVASHVPIILVTGAGGEEIAVKAMKAGAADYLIKDVEGNYLKTLPLTVANTMKAKATEKELQRYHQELERLVQELKKTNAQLRQEIAHRKRAEQELLESMETSANIVETIPSGLFIFQHSPPSEFFLVDANPEAERIFGMDFEPWLGQELVEIWPNARTQGLNKGFQSVIETGQAFKLDQGVYKRGDLTRFFRIRAFRIPGELLGMAFEDVTDRTNAELELRRAHEELERRVEDRTAGLTKKNEELQEEIRRRERAEKLLVRASRMGAMAQMASGVVENFANLLNGITTGAQEALGSLGPTNESGTRVALERILNSARRGAETANHLREFARAGAEPDASHTFEVFDLTDAVREAVQLCKFWLKNRADEQGVEITLNLQLTKGCFISGEEGEVVEVVVNLLRNAAEALPRGGTIKIKTFLDESDSVMWMEDSGVGIPQVDLPKIFDPFWTSKESRAGMGLTTSFGIIRRHGGSIRITSHQGKGTRVWVRIAHVGPPA